MPGVNPRWLWRLVSLFFAHDDLNWIEPAPAPKPVEGEKCGDRCDENVETEKEREAFRVGGSRNGLRGANPASRNKQLPGRYGGER